ncbi:hypothetical protein BU15DRAFT_62547 [Melanogaster broomeanus]|nr:hypothetical protein BU15DRAFT_62547 [Melanogaster broomeanus]
MPLRFIRSKVPAVEVDPLQVAITTTAVARDLVASLQFPPATAVISVLLLIFETIQILVDIDVQMRGRWDSAPELLTRNLQKFEGTLKLVHEFMRKLADSKWSDRFLRKTSIEDALCEYSRMLEEASQSFQVWMLATLIDIHYTVSTLACKGSTSTVIQSSSETRIEAPPPYNNRTSQDGMTQEPGGAQLCVPSDGAVAVYVPTASPMSPPAPSQTEDSIPEITTSGVQDSLDDHYLPEELSSLTLNEDHGFRRYHQSEVMLRGRSRLKDGWWAGAMEVQVHGQPVLIKKYDDDRKGQAYRQWLRDVKMLQNLYLDVDSKLLMPGSVKTQTPEALVRETLRCAYHAFWLSRRFYQDTAMYVQRQFNLTESEVQDFFRGFKVPSRFSEDSRSGLASTDGNASGARRETMASPTHYSALVWICYRTKEESRTGITGMMTTRKMSLEDMQKKINHLVTLARALLPSSNESPELSPKLQALIEDNDFETPSLTLRQGVTKHSWYERNVPADKFSVGDIGYILPGKGWDSFVRLRNILEDGVAELKTSAKAIGEHWCWENVPIRRQPIQAFELPMCTAGWPVAVPPHKQIDVVVRHEAFVSVVKDAWQFLLQNGKKLAQEAGIKPEDLILVTHAGTHQDFYIKDFRPQPFGGRQNKLADPRFPHQQTHGFHQPPSFGFANHSPHFNQPTMPSIVYLFTSLSPSHEPYWSSSPMCALPGAERPPLDRHFTYKIGYKTGFLNYVQLHAEDFENRLDTDYRVDEAYTVTPVSGIYPQWWRGPPVKSANFSKAVVALPTGAPQRDNSQTACLAPPPYNIVTIDLDKKLGKDDSLLVNVQLLRRLHLKIANWLCQMQIYHRNRECEKRRSTVHVVRESTATVSMSGAHLRDNVLGVEATCIEDIVYSLISLFHVNIPVIYREGEKAFPPLVEVIMLKKFKWDVERQGNMVTVVQSTWVGKPSPYSPTLLPAI